MQITIPQSEIETAITNYIQTMVQIGEGMQIDIDLRATRGAEGFQAIIDIYPEGQSRPKPAASGSKDKTKTPPAAKPKTAAAPKKVVSKPLTPPAESEATVEETPVEVPVETLVETAAETTVEAPVTPAPEPEVVAAQIAQSVEEDDAGQTDTAPKAGSIFANAHAKKEEAASDAPVAKSIFGNLRRPINES